MGDSLLGVRLPWATREEAAWSRLTSSASGWTVVERGGVITAVCVVLPFLPQSC